MRAAERADLPAVARLAGELVRLHHGWDAARFLLPEHVEEGYRRWFGRELDNPAAVIVVAADGAGEIVGYSYGTVEERDWNLLLDRAGAIHDIHVAERARRRGVARALMAELIRRLEAHGVPRVVLHTSTANVEGQALFRALGFRATMIEMTRERGGG